MAPRSKEVKALVKKHMRGDIDATYKLGVAYRNGEGVKQDKHEGVRLYGVAASGGHAEAQNQLGYCYRRGMVVDKDEAEAVRLYRQSSDAGVPKAHYNLGYMYHKGLGGLEKDFVEAERLYLLAAHHDVPEAHLNLAALGVARWRCTCTSSTRRSPRARRLTSSAPPRRGDAAVLVA